MSGYSRRAVLGQLSAALMLGPGLAACDRKPAKGAIRIANTAGNLNQTMMALMRQEQFLEQFGLQPDMQAVADGSRIMGGIIGGSADVSFLSGFGQAFPAVERGAEVKVIGGGILLPALALFTGKDEVQSLKDLEGRTIGSGSVGALTYQLTVTLLKQHDVDVSKIRFVNIGSSSDVFRAVSAGSVDAGVGSAVDIEDAAQNHVRLIPNGNMAEELKDFTYSGAWASAKTIGAMRDTLVKALAAHVKLYRFVEQPAAHDAYIKARRTVFTSAPDSAHEAEWRFIQTYRPFATDLLLSPERPDYMQSLNVAFGVQNAKLPFDRIADMSLAKEALALAAPA